MRRGEKVTILSPPAGDIGVTAMRYHHNFQKAAKLSLCRVEPVIFWRRESGRHFSGKRVVMRRECVSPGATGSLIVIYNPQWPAGERPVLALRRPTRVFNFCLQELKAFMSGHKERDISFILWVRSGAAAFSILHTKRTYILFRPTIHYNFSPA